MLTNSIWGDIKYQFSYGNAAVKLIFANVGVFIALGILKLVCFLIQNLALYEMLSHYLMVPASVQGFIRQPWTVFTYMFTHEGILHILFNMLWFYWFSEIFVLFIGDKKIFPLYVLGGLVGAAIYIAAYNLIPVFKPQAESSAMLGASASVMAIVFGAVALSPNYEMRLFIFGDVKIKYIAFISLLLDIMNIPYGNAGGYIAHIGGAATGFAYIKLLQSGTDLAAPFALIGNVFKRKPAVRLTHKSETKASSKQVPTDDIQERLDAILDKISRSGYESLNKEEREFLFQYSNK